MSFLYELEQIIQSRKKEMPMKSYTTKLFKSGLDKILQKVGEETIEYIIDAKNKNIERAKSEAADLLYHLLVSFAETGLSIKEIEDELKKRH